MSERSFFSVWRRLKNSGARANGLSVGNAGVPRGVGLAEGKDGEGGANERNGYPEAHQAHKPDCPGDREYGAENFVSGGPFGEGKQLLLKRDETGHEGWDLWHGARSLSATTIAAIVFLAAEILEPGGPRAERLWAGAGLYCFWFVLAFGAVCWGCRRGQGVFSLVMSGETRFALALVALAFLWSEEPQGMALAGWVAWVAVILGGLADGGWIALVCLRREVPPWRAVRIVVSGERGARRQCWVVLFGEGRQR